MAIKKELSVVLPNRPGTLGDLTAALAKAKVNLLAVDASGGFEYNIVRVVPDNTRKAKAVIKRYGLDVGETNVVCVSVKDEPGALAEIAGKLAAPRSTSIISTPPAAHMVERHCSSCTLPITKRRPDCWVACSRESHSQASPRKCFAATTLIRSPGFPGTMFRGYNVSLARATATTRRCARSDIRTNSQLPTPRCHSERPAPALECERKTTAGRMSCDGKSLSFPSSPSCRILTEGDDDASHSFCWNPILAGIT